MSQCQKVKRRGVTVAGQSIVNGGDGIVFNVSTEGWTIGTGRRTAPGTYLEGHVNFSDQETPVQAGEAEMMMVTLPYEPQTAMA